jgi:hypothetical protein
VFKTAKTPNVSEIANCLSPIIHHPIPSHPIPSPQPAQPVDQTVTLQNSFLNLSCIYIYLHIHIPIADLAQSAPTYISSLLIHPAVQCNDPLYLLAYHVHPDLPCVYIALECYIIIKLRRDDWKDACGCRCCLFVYWLGGGG